MTRTPALIAAILAITGFAYGTAVTADAAPLHPAAAVARVAVPAGSADARTLLAKLVVRADHSEQGYTRSKFDVWNDADHDGRNTRAEVLIAESKVTPSVNSHGTVKGGKWISVYDNVVVTKAARLDVDHLVPLAEAWRSGASTWSAKRREAYGNDLGYGPSLIAVTLSSNRSKGDSDPAVWMPPATSDACAYVKQWIAVKVRWHLSVDRTEHAALSADLDSCSSLAVAKPGTPDIAALVGHTTTKSSGGSSGSGSSSESVYYKNCAAVRAAGKAPLYRGQPGYATPRLDRDGDGVACE